MQTNKAQRNVKIISEVHPQFMGDIDELRRMILQSKLAGANIVKVQLYESERLFNNKEREYLEINNQELKELSNFAKIHEIELSASIFDENKLDLCEKLGFKTYKIASRTLVDDPKLCEKIISTNKEVIISLGMYDFEKLGKPYNNSNLKYLYCISKYPTPLEEIKMPDFNKTFFDGFSDHTIGISACLYAVSKGAQIIEKHFSNSKNLNVATQQAHTCSMNFEDLTLLRNLADSITLLKNKEKN